MPWGPYWVPAIEGNRETARPRRINGTVHAESTPSPLTFVPTAAPKDRPSRQGGTALSAEQPILPPPSAPTAVANAPMNRRCGIAPIVVWQGLPPISAPIAAAKRVLPHNPTVGTVPAGGKELQRSFVRTAVSREGINHEKKRSPNGHFSGCRFGGI